MSLLVEEGIGNPHSNSYVEVSDTDLYHEDLGNSGWVVTQELDNISRREIAIKKATAYIDRKYAGKWRGTKSSSDQALAWPRWGAYDENGYLLDAIPERVKKATMEAALRFFAGTDLLPDASNNKEVLQETVGPITMVYAQSGASGASVSAPVIPVIDSLLRGCVLSDTNLRMIRS